MSHPTFAVCKCGLLKNEHDIQAVMNTSIPRQKRLSRIRKKKKKKDYNYDMSSLPDLSGIGGKDSDIDISNIELSEDSQEEEDREQEKTSSRT